MTTTILLVRHGQTNSNIDGYYMGWSNEDLDQEGYAQVRKLSARLSDTAISAIYSSPLKRAYNTALPVAEPHQLKTEVVQDLIEMQLGDWQSLHIDEIARGWPEVWKQWRTDPTDVVVPGGESFQQVVERVIRTFEKIAAANAGKTVAIVSHEVVVKVAAIYALGAPTSIYRRFDVFNASLSVVHVRDGRARLITLNDTSHLK